MAKTGTADPGDARRNHRLIRLAARVVPAAGGGPSQVCWSPAERQAAYDLMSNKKVRSEALLLQATTAATAGRCAEHEFVYVPVDGSSLVLTDRAKPRFHWVRSARRAFRPADSRSWTRWLPRQTARSTAFDVQFWIIARAAAKKKRREEPEEAELTPSAVVSETPR
ncbi:MAG: hypothetical protein IPG17_32820 [Sandaracinaceae bacterium]|nr:hypothetical protein [Sandaracinaceae bacterium]